MQTEILTPELAAEKVVQRRRARSNFGSWCKLTSGFDYLAKHHQLIVDELQKAVEGYKKGFATNLMILMPPGSAKSTYTSKLFPPWFLGQRDNLAILACSHSAELANDFGRAGRNLVETNEKILGYSLTKDSRAADSWEISNGGYYRAAGCGAGISGRRADLGLIDDFVGKEEDVNSKLFNDKIWNWYVNDFIPRLKPNAVRILICNHRSEDDLAGRLLANEASRWRVIRLRMLIEDEEQSIQDPLGRSVGEWLWPEYFTREMVMERMSNPSASGIEQQQPSPKEGAHFHKEHLQGYGADLLSDLEKSSSIYGASDHAVRTNQQNDNSCLGVGMFKNGILYIHPDIAWDRLDSLKQINKMLYYSRTFHPIKWWAEKENISGAIGPVLKQQMLDEDSWMSVTEVAHKNKDLMARSQSAHAMCELGLVRFPKFAPWYSRAERELLIFPNGGSMVHDDFVSFLSHICRGIYQMVSPNAKKREETPQPDINLPGMNITMRAVKLQQKYDARAERILSLR